MTAKKTVVSLDPHEIRELKNQLHNLKPAIIIENDGLTDTVIQEIDNALTDNELIKVRTHATTSEELVTIAEEICSKTKAALIQTIGYIVAIYRKNPQVEEQ